MITGSDERLARTLVVMNGKGGVGKCVESGATVYNPAFGTPMTVAEAVTSRMKHALSFTSAHRLVHNLVRDWVDSGTQKVVRIELASGRSITVTPHHQMLAPDGWRRADQIQVGETLASAGHFPAPWRTVQVDPGELDLLAILLAEGNTSTPGTYFSTTDPEILALATTGAASLGADVRVHHAGYSYRIAGSRAAPLAGGLCECGCGEPIPAATTKPSGRVAVLRAPQRFLPRHGSTPRTEMLRFRTEHGLDYVLAKHKTMPKIAYQLSQEQLGRFIAVFWMCDGYVGVNGQLELILASEKLVKAFQHLLLRFGIQSRVSYREAKFDGTIFDAWRLTVYSPGLARFHRNIPLWGRKAERLAARVQKMGDRSNANVGSPSLTPELWERIRAFAPPTGRKRPGQPRLRDVAERLGWDFTAKVPLRELLTNRSDNGRRYISQRSIQAYMDCFGGHDELGHLTTPDIHWDRVTAVVDAGETHVYDLSVPGPANFVANDLVVHNTSITANISGQLAQADYKVLAVDLDVSGNLKLDLGYVGHDQDDDGKGLVEAVFNGAPLNIIRNVRTNLDVIPGGRQLEMLVALSFTAMAGELTGGGVHQAFAARLAAVADGYDVITIDGAPGNAVLQDMALTAGRYVLIPTKTDSAGWDGLRMVGPRVKKIRGDNPLLTYLGVVFFAHQTNATRVIRNTRARLDEVSDTVPIFDAYIRHSETAAHDCRMRGQLAHELAADAGRNTRERLQALRSRGDGPKILPAQLSGTADSLAGDYQNLAREILLRIGAHEQSTPIISTGR